MQSSITQNEYEKSYLDTKIKELEKLNVQDNEIEELSVKRKSLLERSKIIEISQMASKKLVDSDNNIISELWNIHRQLIKFSDIFDPLNKNLESIILELESFDHEILSVSENLNEDSLNIDEIENRYFKIKEMERKYNINSSKFSEIIQLSKDRVKNLDNVTFDLERIKNQLNGVLPVSLRDYLLYIMINFAFKIKKVNFYAENYTKKNTLRHY